MNAVSLNDIESAAGNWGLVCRGGFTIVPEDDVPGFSMQDGPGTLILFGNAGSSIWASFSESPEYGDGLDDPLNRWSERIGTALATDFGGEAHFPFGGPPYRPFLRWAKKAENLQNSRLGMLIHPEYGLWHAYRFAIAFTGEIPGIDNLGSLMDVCARCVDQPCLSACPVGALGPRPYDVPACHAFLDTGSGADCLSGGCLVRRACPVSRTFGRDPAQSAHHMRYFHR